MDFFEVVESRRSVRTFTEQPVSEEVVQRCLEAARLAPSWRNGQCWRFIVVRDSDTIARLAGQRVYGYPINHWLRSAPVVVVVCANVKESGEHDGVPYWAVDAAIAMEHLVLAATAKGLGACWIGGFNASPVRELLGVPLHVQIIGWTPLGYPAPREGLMGRSVKTLAGSHKRKPIEEIVFSERWGS